MGTLSVSLVKISALDLYVKIFPSKSLHRIAYTVMLITASYSLSYIITSLSACQPFAYNWDKLIQGGRCIDTSKFYVWQAIISMILDITVVALPMPLVWGLKMRYQKKVYLTIIFGMGIL